LQYLDDRCAENSAFTRNADRPVRQRRRLVPSTNVGIGDLLERCTNAASEATAVIAAGSGYRFGALADASHRTADQLTPGTRVLIRLDNTPASIAAIHAAWMAGCSIVSASLMVPDVEVRRRAETAGASSVLTPYGSQGLEVSIKATEGQTPAPPDEALVMFTSGTTGTPKGASLTFAALQASVAGIAVGSGLGGDGRLPRVPDRDPQLILVPLAHMGGFLGTLSAWWVGKPVLLTEKFSPGLIFDLVHRYRLGVLKLTPAMVWDLVQADSDGQLPRVSSVNVGTAALPEATRIAFERKYGVPILRNYGQTEFAGAIAFERPDDVAVGIRPDNTVGRIAPGVEVAIVDADGNRVASGEVGEVTARATSAMSGYLDTAGRPADPGAWLHTGDLGVLDDEGFLSVVGRLRDLIICGGFNVYPAQLEAALNDVAAVADSAVVGIPDERLGEVPVAAVVLRRGEQATSDGIRCALRSSLAPYELPRRVLVVDDIPRLATGKVDRAGVGRLFGDES
jgi:long-chain acyl-CoA synthetase